jgi:hypothetical protein
MVVLYWLVLYKQDGLVLLEFKDVDELNLYIENSIVNNNYSDTYRYKVISGFLLRDKEIV